MVDTKICLKHSEQCPEHNRHEKILREWMGKWFNNRLISGLSLAYKKRNNKGNITGT